MLVKSRDQSRQELLIKSINSHKVKNLELILGKGLDAETHNSWLINGCKIIQTDHAINEHFRRPSSLIPEIREDLINQRVSWVYVITPDTDLIFTIAFNHYLIWSYIQRSVKEIFFALLILNGSFLEDYNDAQRMRNIELTHLHLRRICLKKTVKTNITQLDITKSLFSVIRNLSQNINKYLFDNLAIENIKEISNTIKSLVRFEHKPLPLVNYVDFRESKDPFLNALYASIKQNKSFWILDVFNTLLLELFPLISKSTKSKIGSYYTPLSLAATLVHETLSQLDYSNLQRPLIHDPAMGTGIILVFALDWLVNAQIDRKNKISFLENRSAFFLECITGNDIDKQAIQYATAFFQLFCRFDRYIVSQFTSFDYITNYLENPDNGNTFDIVLTNPPYIPFHSRFAKKFLGTKDIVKLKDLLPTFIGMRDNLYLIFMGIALNKFLSPSGVLGIVLDHSFLDLPSYGRLREVLIQNYEIRYILKSYDFKNIATVDLSLMVISKNKNEKLLRWQENIRSNIQIISSDMFRENRNISFRYTKHLSFINELETFTDPLGEILEIKCGLEYGGLLKTAFLSDQKTDDTWFPVIDGSNGLPSPYLLFWVDKMPNSFVRFDKAFESKLKSENKNISPNQKEVILISGEIDRFLQPKLILRQTSNRFIVSFDSNQYLTLRNTHVLYLPKPPYSLFLILGILNSNLGNFLGEQLNILRKGGKSRYPQIRINDLMRFPIVKINSNKEIITEIEKLVGESIKIGRNMSKTLSSLWDKLNGPKTYKTQKYFLRKMLDDSILHKLPEKEFYIYQQLKSDLNLLKEISLQIDVLVCRLYGLSCTEFLKRSK